MSKQPTKIKFRREVAGVYFGQDETYHYTVTREDRNEWLLVVKKLITTSGVRHAVGRPVYAQTHADTKQLACGVANAYSELGPNFSSSAYGHMSRMTVAIRVAYTRLWNLQ